MADYLRNIGISLDRFLNALLFAGSPDDTVSVHAANSQAQGRRWACILCRWLSWTVETNHCKKTLEDAPTKTAASLKALFQLLIVSVLVYYSPMIAHRIAWGMW